MSNTAVRQNEYSIDDMLHACGVAEPVVKEQVYFAKKLKPMCCSMCSSLMHAVCRFGGLPRGIDKVNNFF